MARYIDADSIRFYLHKGWDLFIADKQNIDSIPTADVVEVKHGKWIEKEEIYGDVYYTCSNCNNDWTTIDGTPQENFMSYCPNCGAKMDSQL